MARSPDQHTRVNPEPRITANELARYMVSGDTGRIGIIRRAKESTTPMRTRYRDVRTSLCNALSDAAGERRILAEAKTRFEQRADDSALSEFRRDDAAKSLEVLKAYGEMRNQLAGYDYSRPPTQQPSLVISNVEVPVTLDLLIQRSRNDIPEIGGVLLRLTQPDEDETENAAAKRRNMGLFAATLVRMHVEKHFAGNHSPAHQLCWSVDVQAREVHVAPRTFAQRVQAMESACMFIAAMWDHV